MKKDEKILKEKIQENLPSDFDKKFWQKYENEFESQSIGFNLWIPTTAMAVVIGAVLIYQLNAPTLSEKELMKVALQTEMFENMEMLEELDDEMLAMNDQDWDVLLENN